MAYEQRPGDVSVFRNDKRGNEKAPDHKGYLILHRDARKGDKIEVALWEKSGAKGPFLAGKISDQREQKKAGPQERDDF